MEFPTLARLLTVEINRPTVLVYSLLGTIGTLATGKCAGLFLKHALYDRIEMLRGTDTFVLRNVTSIRSRMSVPVRPTTVAGWLGRVKMASMKRRVLKSLVLQRLDLTIATLSLPVRVSRSLWKTMMQLERWPQLDLPPCRNMMAWRFPLHRKLMVPWFTSVKLTLM